MLYNYNDQGGGRPVVKQIVRGVNSTQNFFACLFEYVVVFVPLAPKSTTRDRDSILHPCSNNATIARL